MHVLHITRCVLSEGHPRMSVGAMIVVVFVMVVISRSMDGAGSTELDPWIVYLYNNKCNLAQNKNKKQFL